MNYLKRILPFFVCSTKTKLDKMTKERWIGKHSFSNWLIYWLFIMPNWFTQTIRMSKYYLCPGYFASTVFSCIWKQEVDGWLVPGLLSPAGSPHPAKCREPAALNRPRVVKPCSHPTGRQSRLPLLVHCQHQADVQNVCRRNCSVMRNMQKRCWGKGGTELENGGSTNTILSFLWYGPYGYSRKHPPPN